MYNSTFQTVLIALGITTAFTLFLNGVEDTFAMGKALTVKGVSLEERDHKKNDVNGLFLYSYGSKGMPDNSTSLDDL